MAEVFESVIKIETGESEQSVKGLKKQINDLRDHILNLEKGTDEYNDAVAQLMDSQRRLDEVMSLTKKTATALDGSYDALAHQMALLRKEWKATNDEARRNELGKQIDELNDQLKELDASTGNFQRNVGNYPKEMGKMQEATKETAVACKSFQQQMSEMNESIEPTKQKFESVANIASGIAGGFAAVQGAMALLGIENENVEKTFVKLQAAMALAQGVGGMKGLVEGVGRAKVAFAGLGDKIKAVNKTMGKSGWLAIILLVVSAVAALVSWVKNNKEETEELNATLESSKNLYQATGTETSKLVGNYRLLQAQWKNLTTESQKNKWIKKNAGEFKQLGLEIKNVNDAQKAFVEQSELVVRALSLQAQASALKSVYESAYAEAYTKNKELEDQKKDIKEGYNPSNAEAKEAGLSSISGDYQTQTTMATSNYGGTGTYYTTATPYVNEQGAEKLRDAVDARIARNNAEVDEILADLVKVEQAAAEAAKAVEDVGLNGKSTTTTTTTTTTETEDPNITLKKTIKERIQLENQATQRKLANLDVERNKEIENAYATINDKDKLEAELERIEQLYAGKEYEVEQELLNKKLDILNEWKQANTDANIEKVEIAQEIADTEIEIEQHKQNRLTEIARQGNENRNKNATVEDVQNQVVVGMGMVEDFKQQVKDFDEQWKSMNFTQKAAEIGNIVATSLQGASQIFNQLADMYANEEDLSEEEIKKVKNLRIAGATMDMLSGIVGAISSAAGMGPVGWVLGAIQAGIIATTGALNIANIKKQDVSGNSSGSGASGASVTPANSAIASELPATYTRQITGASEIDELNKDQRVYILESDIQASNKRVQVRENESSF